ncbi:MAG: DnaB-like helicase C-terminal domain-containing protein [Desulfobacterales bacterium]
MDMAGQIKKFYGDHVPGAVLDNSYLKAPCPFCKPDANGGKGTLVVYLNPDSYFTGYFRCLNRCRPGGFPLYYARLMGIDPQEVPGFNPDHDPFVRDIAYPIKNLKADIVKFTALMTAGEYAHFEDFGVSPAVLNEMTIGFNGRYLVYPYRLEDGNCYAARCILPGRPEDNFWYGDSNFFTGDFQIFDTPEIERCRGGALFIVEGEDNLLALKELGYPGIAVPAAADLEHVGAVHLADIRQVFIAVANAPEAQLAAREAATRIGFKVRLLKWPAHVRRGYTLCDLARDKGPTFRSAVAELIRSAEAFSPFPSPAKEHRKFFEQFDSTGDDLAEGFRSGFDKLDRALGGSQGINIMGGPPKAGKSCFYMQVSTEMARRRTPVIYYDFENGRRKIYSRTFSRLVRLTAAEIRQQPDDAARRRIADIRREFAQLLQYFKVVTDRKLNPDIMRRQVDFLQHETRRDSTVVVIDSLHKLPFKDLSDRRTGIDSWLRHMEAIRDEQNVSFFVISELSRAEGGQYARTPDLGAFKESGDIEYSADNAMILLPDWNPIDPISSKERVSSLWLVASRENSPGKIASYRLAFPHWGFEEL